jgi:hypothetical protein
MYEQTTFTSCVTILTTGLFIYDGLRPARDGRKVTSSGESDTRAFRRRESFKSYKEKRSSLSITEGKVVAIGTELSKKY